MPPNSLFSCLALKNPQVIPRNRFIFHCLTNQGRKNNLVTTGKAKMQEASVSSPQIREEDFVLTGEVVICN